MAIDPGFAPYRQPRELFLELDVFKKIRIASQIERFFLAQITNAPGALFPASTTVEASFNNALRSGEIRQDQIGTRLRPFINKSRAVGSDQRTFHKPRL